MEKRKITVLVGGRPCSIYSDDPEEYVSALEQRANAVMRETAKFSGASAYTNAVLSVLSLTDALMRTEQGEQKPGERTSLRKNAAKKTEEEKGQISVWELLGEKQEKNEKTS